MYDIIISGAGPAGSKCAEIVSKAGFKVALIEKDSKWRKPCGGAVSSRIFKYYPQLRKENLAPITGMTIFSADYHQLHYSWKNIRDYSINVDRLSFDNFLRNVALDSGANLFDNNTSINFITKNKKRIGIRTRTSSGKKDYLGKLLIIADGMSSKLAFKSNLREKWKIHEIGIVKCAIIEGESSLDVESMYMFFKPFKGYSWIFPLGENRFNVGCGTWQEENLNYNVHQIFGAFLRDPIFKRFFPGLNYKIIWEGCYPIPAIGVLEKSLYSDNLMIIGDAAGFVSPISGEGIHPSIVSGDSAAKIAINALETENLTGSNLKNYKNYANIKKIIRNFKIKLSMVDFFFKNQGKNLSKMLKLAHEDPDFKEEVVNMFLFNQIPSKNFILKLQKNQKNDSL